MAGMGYGGPVAGDLFAALGLLTWLVWLGVGALAIVWLWQHIQKK